MMKKLLRIILQILAERTIMRYHPLVIGITGSVGKTTAKEAIYAVIGRRFRAKKSEENYNNEIGIPMTVLDITPLNNKTEPAGIWRGRIKLCVELLGAAWYSYIGRRSDYPEVLVLELAADRPGDVTYLVNTVHPRIGVITAIGETPVHVQYYAGPQAVAKEKSQLIKSLPAHNALALLNADDPTVLNLKDATRAPVQTFGFAEDANIRASAVSFYFNDDVIAGLSFKLHHGLSFLPIRIPRVLGSYQLYGVLAAVGIGLHFGMNLVEISETFESIDFPRGRMCVIPGIKQTTIIDDTYNSSPIAVIAAVHVLNDFGSNMIKLHGGAGRRVAILGDMRELGEFEEEAHKKVGLIAGKRVDILITIGTASRAASNAARGLMRSDQIIHFETLEEALGKIKDLIRDEDIILVKGSQASRMEKIVKILMAEPRLADHLLIRQTGEWLKK